MEQNTKIKVVISVLIIILGLFLFWFGLRPKTLPPQTPQPSPQQERIKESTSSAAMEVEGDKVKVTKVIDGDTFEIENGKLVRVLGIDTPETKDPRRPVGCFGKEASNKTKSLIEGKVVILIKDVSETDKFARLLRYVFLPLEGDRLLFINDFLIREGFAKVLTIPPDVKYAEQFLQAQTEARENKRGLWGKC